MKKKRQSQSELGLYSFLSDKAIIIPVSSTKVKATGWFNQQGQIKVFILMKKDIKSITSHNSLLSHVILIHLDLSTVSDKRINLTIDLHAGRL